MVVAPRTRPGLFDPDLALVERLQGGETDAFGSLWHKYEPRIRRFFYRATRSDADAEDLAGETFLAALRCMPRFSVNGENVTGKRAAAFGTFLHAIARNQLSLWYRRRRCRPEVSLAEVLPGDEDDLGAASIAHGFGTSAAVAGDPCEPIFVAERRDALCCVLASVESDPQFAAIVLHYIAGWTHDDVGRFLGTKSESINTRLQDGRKSLRRGYERLGSPPV